MSKYVYYSKGSDQNEIHQQKVLIRRDKWCKANHLGFHLENWKKNNVNKVLVEK